MAKVQDIVLSRLGDTQTKTASAEGAPEGASLPQGPEPESVKVASSWTDPTKEITPEFLDQLAEDWSRTPAEVDKLATATALAIQAQEKEAMGKALVGGLAAGAGVAAGAAGGLYKGKQMGTAAEQAKDPAQIQMAFNVGARRGWQAAQARKQDMAQAGQAQKAAGSVSSLLVEDPTPAAPEYSPQASKVSTVVQPTQSATDLLLLRAKQAMEHEEGKPNGKDGGKVPPQFLAQQKKKDEGKDKKDEEEKKESSVRSLLLAQAKEGMVGDEAARRLGMTARKALGRIKGREQKLMKTDTRSNAVDQRNIAAGRLTAAGGAGVAAGGAGGAAAMQDKNKKESSVRPLLLKQAMDDMPAKGKDEKKSMPPWLKDKDDDKDKKKKEKDKAASLAMAAGALGLTAAGLGGLGLAGYQRGKDLAEKDLVKGNDRGHSWPEAGGIGGLGERKGYKRVMRKEDEGKKESSTRSYLLYRAEQDKEAGPRIKALLAGKSRIGTGEPAAKMRGQQAGKEVSRKEVSRKNPTGFSGFTGRWES